MADGTVPKPGTRKVTVGALSGAVVTLLAYLLKDTAYALSPEVTAAAGTLVTAILFYLTPETYR